MFHRPMCKIQNYKTVRRKLKNKSLGPWIRQWFPLKAQVTKKKKIRYIGCDQHFKLLCFKGP